MDPSLVSTKEIDYLDEDKPLRGQNYVCLSFISPEDVLIDKDVFFFTKFIESFSSQMDMLLTNLKQKYPDDAQLMTVIKENNSHLFNVKEMNEQYKFFKGLNNQELDSEFLKMNDYKTSMRGIKVRGVFDTMKEAQTRCDVLKRMGDKFDIYVAQVGCWCPWSPNPEDLQDQEYSETTLNTLMKKYKENQMDKDSLYEQRKQEKLEEAMKEVAEKKKAQMELVSSSVAENAPVEAVSVTDVTVDPSSAPSVSVSDITSPQPEEVLATEVSATEVSATEVSATEVSATEVSPYEDYH
jgi:hypothetical protein